MRRIKLELNDRLDYDSGYSGVNVVYRKYKLDVSIEVACVQILRRVSDATMTVSRRAFAGACESGKDI